MEITIRTALGCKLVFNDDKVGPAEYHLTVVDAAGAECSTHIVRREDIKRLGKAS